MAVALFAGSIVVVLALLPALTGRGTETQDRLVAARLPDAVRIELKRLAATGLEALAAQAPTLASPPIDGLALVATRDGGRLNALDYGPSPAHAIAEVEQYFLVECWKFPEEPWRFESSDSAMALAVRVSWPYRLPSATAPVPQETRHEIWFPVGINR